MDKRKAKRERVAKLDEDLKGMFRRLEETTPQHLLETLDGLDPPKPKKRKVA